MTDIVERTRKLLAEAPGLPWKAQESEHGWEVVCADDQPVARYARTRSHDRRD